MEANPNCPKCHASAVYRNGKVLGKQRYRCKECGFQFTRTTPSCSRLAACSSSGAPVTRATVSLVRSSSVGPRPPVVMTRSLRVRASRRTCSSRPALSPPHELEHFDFNFLYIHRI